jgi:hypothetical protein
MSTITAPQPRTSQQAARHTDAHCVTSRLGRYTDHRAGTTREIVARAGAGCSVLVVDRDALTLGDGRLVAHLAADEPPENARIVCSMYLADDSKGHCRRVTAEDLGVLALPEGEGSEAVECKSDKQTRTELTDARGRSYRLELVATHMSIPEVRWQQHVPDGQAGPARVVSVRHVIACLESYEPIRSLSRGALVRYRRDPEVSVSALRDEMECVCKSRIVLNRGLREAVLQAVETKGLSMSQIAMRCGRVKYDHRGNVSGETSWLSRRLGLAPEGGEPEPTPWIHSDVLALIVRDGLGASPHEVEL